MRGAHSGWILGSGVQRPPLLPLLELDRHCSGCLQSTAIHAQTACTRTDHPAIMPTFATSSRHRSGSRAQAQSARQPLMPVQDFGPVVKRQCVRIIKRKRGDSCLHSYDACTSVPRAFTSVYERFRKKDDLAEVNDIYLESCLNRSPRAAAPATCSRPDAV